MLEEIDSVQDIKSCLPTLLILLVTILITFTIIPYVFSTVFKYVFKRLKTILCYVFPRQMEAANRLEEVRERLQLAEGDPIPRAVLDG